MAKEFTGKIALVTGGASGIGAQVSRDLAENGASVVIADLTVERAQAVVNSLATDTGVSQKHTAIALDVRVKAQVDAAIANIESLYGQPADLIVNSAGVMPGVAPLKDLKEEDVDLVMDINFKGTFLVTQAAGRALLAAGRPGSIVNIASISGVYATATLAHYGASKAAVIQMSRVAAREWGSKGIRVNVVLPGVIDDTPLGEGYEQQKKLYALKVPLHRLGQTTDISKGIQYLLSDRCSFVTGTSIELSGGYGVSERGQLLQSKK